MRYFLYCFFSLSVAIILLILSEQWLHLNEITLPERPDAKVSLKNIQFDLNEYHSWAGWLQANEATVTPDGLIMYQIEASLKKTEQKINLKADYALWPNGEDKIYIPGNVRIEDDQLKMVSKEMVVDLSEGICYTDKETEIESDGFKMISQEYHQKLKHLSEMFHGSKN